MSAARKPARFKKQNPLAELLTKGFSVLRKYPKVSSFVLGGLSVLGFPPYSLWYVFALSFCVFMALLNTRPTRKAFFVCGALFGFSHFAFGLSWVLQALTFFDGKLTYLMPVAFAGAGLLGIFFIGLPVYVSSFFDKQFRPFALAALLIFFEWVQSFIATGFPWNMKGTVVSHIPEMIQIASVIGTYGLGLLLLCAFLIPALKPRLLFTSALILGGVYVFGYWRLHTTQLKIIPDVYVRIVQPDISPGAKHHGISVEEQIERQVSLSRRPSVKPLTYVVWPETSILAPLERNDGLRNILMRAVPSGGYLIAGALRVTEKPFHLYNSVLLLDDLGETRAYYDKAHLVPFGEYVPFRQYLPIERIVPGMADFTPGVGRYSIDMPKGPSVGLLVCYEIIFPTQIVHQEMRPGYLINVTNDGWYKDSAGPYQHLATTRMRAVEEGLSILRAASTGISAAITPLGQITSSLPLMSEGYIDTEISAALPPTLYAKFGNTAPLLLILFILTTTAFLSYAQRRS